MYVSSTNGQPATDLISGILYQPYYLLTMGIAGIVVWSFRRRGSGRKIDTYPNGCVPFTVIDLSRCLINTSV